MGAEGVTQLGNESQFNLDEHLILFCPALLTASILTNGTGGTFLLPLKS